LLPGSAGRVLPSGHLVFERGASLWAVAFDIGTFTVSGNPVPVLEGVRVEGGGAEQFAIADEGTLAYVAADGGAARRLFWVNRQGGEEPVDGLPPRAYFYPRVSPTGDRIAVDVRDQQNDVWIWHLTRKTLTRLTFDPLQDRQPEWTPDGRRIIFASLREGSGVYAPYWQIADGTGSAERLATEMRSLDQPVISADGKRLILRSLSAETSDDVVVMSIEGDRQVEPLVATRFMERSPALSPDGRWLAYESSESGRPEVYVRPFPRVNDGRWQISTGGGSRSVWNRNGKELLYVGPSGMLMSVPVETANDFSFETPSPILDLSAAALDQLRHYDISPDGKRFLIIKNDVQQESARINVVLNWIEDLKRLVPTN
jgi:Tol biopolymer transport system component